MAILPPHYVDIPTALASRGFVSVIAIVVDILPLYRTKGSSACITFTVKDSNLENGHTWDGLKVKYFNDNENYLPQIQLKDVALLRNIRVRPYNGKPIAVAAQYEKIQWAVFRPGSDPNSSVSPISGPVAFEPFYSEKTYAQSLLDLVSSNVTVQGELRPRVLSQDSHVVHASSSKPKLPGPRQFLLIKDVEERMYVDLLGEVVKAYLNDSEKATLYITDYTVNKDLLDYQQNENPSRDGDEFGYTRRAMKSWPGPFGQRTLQITLWEPHASYARQYIKPRGLVRLSNVHIKRSRIAQNLEASIHTDRNFPEKIHVKAVYDKSDGRVRDLLQRKSSYWKENGGNPEESNEGATSSKKSKKQQQRKKQEKSEEGQPSLKSSSLPIKRRLPNQNIQAINPEIPPRSLEDILSNESHENTSPDNIKYRLPFQNLCYRAFARVIDFFPPNLEDFSVPLRGETSMFTSPANDEEHNPDDPIRWEWRFCLLLESGSPPPPGQHRERMKLFVSGYDAEYLLKMDAVDLRRNKQALEELREKLFILWGDLEERKRKAIAEGEPNSQPLNSVSSIPFVCCVKEYGVECAHRNNLDLMQIDDSGCGHEGCLGWERRFAMFETVIHS